MGFPFEFAAAIVNPPESFSDVFSVLFDDGDISNSWSQSSTEGDDEDESSVTGENVESKAAFWASQRQLVDEAMNRSGSVEKRVRAETEAVTAELLSTGVVCRCSSRPIDAHCRKCVMAGVANRLQNDGYNSAVCKSKWKKSSDIPAGEHSYIDVVVDTKKGTVRLVIELSFRAEFEMARASTEYNTLINSLPEVFVGKSEKLRNVVKILCAAAKKCMKENKLDLAPWRKQKYMQSKWLGAFQRLPAGAPLMPVATTALHKQTRQRTSMLTFDLLCNIAVQVL